MIDDTLYIFDALVISVLAEWHLWIIIITRHHECHVTATSDSDRDKNIDIMIGTCFFMLNIYICAQSSTLRQRHLKKVGGGLSKVKCPFPEYGARSVFLKGWMCSRYDSRDFLYHLFVCVAWVELYIVQKLSSIGSAKSLHTHATGIQ